MRIVFDASKIKMEYYNDNNDDIISSLPFSQKEKYSRNRNKTGYNVFQSWFYHDWKSYNNNKKKKLLEAYKVWKLESFDDDDDESVMSDVPIHSADTIRLCA